LEGDAWPTCITVAHGYRGDDEAVELSLRRRSEPLRGMPHAEVEVERDVVITDPRPQLVLAKGTLWPHLGPVCH
jgi:hypothetical protein